MRSPNRSVLPCLFGFYLQTAHRYACSHTEPTAYLLEKAYLLEMAFGICLVLEPEKTRIRWNKQKKRLNDQDFTHVTNDMPAALSIEALSVALRSLLSSGCPKIEPAVQKSIQMNIPSLLYMVLSFKDANGFPSFPSCGLGGDQSRLS
jgi:hypothetical protein